MLSMMKGEFGTSRVFTRQGESMSRTSPTTRRLFVPGFFGWVNKGDVALAFSFFPWISRIFDADGLTLTSFNPATDSRHFDFPMLSMVIRPRSPFHKYTSALVRRVPFLAPLLTVFRMAYTSVVIWYLDRWAPLYLRNPKAAAVFVPSHVRQVAAAIVGAEAVVAMPGGYLNALRFTDDLWLFHLPTLRLAHSLGKSALLGPCSIGPFTRSHSRFARSALSRTALILVREDESVAVLEGLGLPAGRAIRTPDMAFGFSPAESTPEDPDWLAEVRTFAAGREIVGVSVRSHSFPGHVNAKRMQETYLREVAAAVGALSEDAGAVIVVVPQTQEDSSVERDLARILATAHPHAPLMVLNADLSPSELMRLYGLCRLLVGTRMHANILAMMAGTAVAAIAYLPKTQGILESMGLSDWGVPIDGLTHGRLDELVRRQWSRATALGIVATERSTDQRLLLIDVGTQIRGLMQRA
jgi:polysaccharide pyruvyl transferase WcaK-like protein